MTATSTTPRRRRTTYGITVGGLSLAMVLAACSGGGSTSTDTTSSGQSSAQQSTSSTTERSDQGASDPALAKYYNQTLDWKDCGPVQCAQLTVPIDYAEPGGATIELAVDKVPAKGESKGALVVNPGGPGGSGYDYAAAADRIVTPRIRESYDIVGFDPRGVQRSAPITCLGDDALDRHLGSDPTPDTKAEEKAALAGAKKFAKACQQNAGPLLAHVSTVEVAKDMDILRAALGEKSLNYLGKSYGTLIGAIYAGRFPEHVGRFVLDGVVPPDITSEEMNKGQAEGFERATRSYVKHCVAQGDCPLGDSLSEGMKRIRSFLKKVDQDPLPVSNQGGVTELTEGWASMGIAAAMYTKMSWPVLTQAFEQAFAGDGNALMTLADQYADRTANGTYTGNIMQVINAVSCLDRPAPSGLEPYEKDEKKFSKVAPTWGPMLAWGSMICGVWPIDATRTPHKISAAGSGPILVVGTTRDPATPYEWSVRLAKQLEDGHLLTYDGDGHTAYGQSSCVNDVVDDYLIEGTVPPEGKAC